MHWGPFCSTAQDSQHLYVSWVLFLRLYCQHHSHQFSLNHVCLNEIEAFYSQRKGAKIVRVRGMDEFLTIDDDDVVWTGPADPVPVQAKVPTQAEVPVQIEENVQARELARIDAPT